MKPPVRFLFPAAYALLQGSPLPALSFFETARSLRSLDYRDGWDGFPRATPAIVNATAHRDYSSNAGIQVMVFTDRVEIWNPGQLPPGLTPEWLRTPHSSIPRNPLIADPLFLAHYIEKAGTGTLDMIRQCLETGLPEPEFEQRGNQFVVSLWRDWLTEEIIGSLGLNDRQRRALTDLKTAERIGNTEYQSLLGVAKRTAHRDLVDLVRKGVLEKIGTTGKGTAYVLRKGATKGCFLIAT